MDGELVLRRNYFGRQFEAIWTPASKIRELRGAVPADPPGDQASDLSDFPSSGPQNTNQYLRVIPGVGSRSVERLKERPVSTGGESAGDVGGPAGSSQENGEADPERRRLR